MNPLKWLLAGCAALALASLPSFARETSAFPEAASDLRPDPALHTGTLPSGVRFAVLKNAEPKGRVSLRLLVLAGSLHETDAQTGLAHFLEHMAFNGSRHFPPGELVRYFQRIGMGFGNDTNAYTTFDHTAYLIELPTNDAAALEEGVKVLADYAQGLSLPEGEIERERGVILAEKRDRENASYRTFLAELAFLFPTSRLSERMPIGLEQTIRFAPRAEFTDFYDTWYRPERTLIVAVGDVDPSAAEQAIQQHFGHFKARAASRASPDAGPFEPAATGRAAVHHELEAPSTRVTIQSTLPLRYRQDSGEARADQLMISLAHQALALRLEALSETETSPFTSSSTGASPVYDLALNASIELTGPDAKWADSLRIAADELRRALQYGFSADEVRTVVANSRNALEEAARGASTRRSPALASQLVRSFAAWRVFTHPEQDLALLTPVLDAASEDSLLQALRRAWAPPQHWLVFVTGNQPNLTWEAVSTVYAEALATEVTPPKQRSSGAFAYENFGPPAAAPTLTPLPTAEAVRATFSNGVIVNARQTSFEANRVRFVAKVGYGRMTEPADKQGLALLSSVAFNQGGLGRHSAEDLRRLLAGRTVAVDFSVADDAFILSGSASPKDLDLALRLLTAYLTDPGFRPEGFRLAKRQLEEAYRELETEPGGLYQLEFTRALVQDHRFGLPPRAELEARTPDEVRTWLTPALAGGPIELTVVGDVTTDGIFQIVGSTLGALPTRPQRETKLELRSTSAGKGLARVDLRRTTNSVPKALVSVAWLTEDRWNISRTRKLGALAEVFSNRLLFKIREELGDAYSPSASHLPSETYTGLGWLSATVECAPEQVEKIVSVIQAVASDMAAGTVTEDERSRAVRPILTGIRDNFRNNAYWLGSVLNGSAERPERLTWPTTLQSDFESITQADLNELAKRYMDVPDLIWSARFETTP